VTKTQEVGSRQVVSRHLFIQKIWPRLMSSYPGQKNGARSGILASQKRIVKARQPNGPKQKLSPLKSRQNGLGRNWVLLEHGGSLVVAPKVMSHERVQWS
jgi:hypothetical protein